MEKVITTERKPIKLWLNDIEDGALEQAKNLANLPFIYKHVAIMPDCHQGYGMPIGGVIATDGVVIPNAVGVDIGCGMCAVKTSMTEISNYELKRIMSYIRIKVPMGFKHHKEKQNIDFMPDVTLFDEQHIVHQQFESAQKQIGTLGGGNHFIEIQSGSDGYIWLMIHSGSRNLGLRVANHYNKIAIELNEKWYSSVPTNHQLAFLPLDVLDIEGYRYLDEMQYCVDFAFNNRKLMMDRVKESVCDICGDDVEFNKIINIAHNYAIKENHFGKNVMVHRKGATLARKRSMGIIPGSQGTSSFIVEGVGNKDSFESCSHGAGRKMGRKQAIKKLDLKEEKQRLDDLDIIHSIRHKKDLDEAPGAYKDINVVMKNQQDLVKIVTRLEPIAVLKG